MNNYRKRIKNKDKKTHISAKRQAILFFFLKTFEATSWVSGNELSKSKVFSFRFIWGSAFIFCILFPLSFDYDLPLLVLHHQICSMTVERDYCCFLHVQRIQNVEKLHKKNVTLETTSWVSGNALSKSKVFSFRCIWGSAFIFCILFPLSFDYDLPLLVLRHQISSMTVERDYCCCFLHVQRIQNVEKLHKKNVTFEATSWVSGDALSKSKVFSFRFIWGSAFIFLLYFPCHLIMIYLC